MGGGGGDASDNVLSLEKQYVNITTVRTKKKEKKGTPLVYHNLAIPSTSLFINDRRGYNCHNLRGVVFARVVVVVVGR